MAWPHYIRPEFGCFCPSPRLRREVRIALISLLFGVISGALGVVALSAPDRNANSTGASMSTSKTAITTKTLNEAAPSAAAHDYQSPEAPNGTVNSKAQNERIKSNAVFAADATDEQAKKEVAGKVTGDSKLESSKHRWRHQGFAAREVAEVIVLSRLGAERWEPARGAEP